MTGPYLPSPGAAQPSQRRPSREIVNEASHDACMSVPLPGAIRSSPRAHYLVNKQRGRLSPADEGSQEQGGGQHRRRIAVACGRCRKRKIRCSGDPGDGTGCNNCKTSGTDPSQCQFLRVNSVDCATNGYSYALPSGVGASLTGEAGSYAPSQMPSGSVMGALPIGGPLAYARPPSQSYPVLATKSFSLPHYSGYGDDGAEAGSYVTPSVISPPHESQGSAALFGPQEGLRAWNPFGSAPKPSGALFVEGNPPPYGGGSVPLVSSTSSRGSLTAPESSPLFPGLGSLSSSLPATGPAGERLLPRPQQHGVVGSGGSASLANGGNIHDALPYPSWDSLPLRPTQQDWTYETRSPAGEQEAKRTSSESTSTAYGVSNPKVSLASSQDASLAFESLPASAARHESAAPASSYCMSGSVIPGMSKASYDGPDIKGAVTSAGDLSLGCGSSPDLYSYTTGSNYRHGSHGSRSGSNEGTLVSGQTYTRLHPGQPAHPSPLVPLRRDSRESCTRSTHRAPAGSFRA